MNKKNLLFFLLIFSLIPFLHGETRGYLSFEYIKGQDQADVSHGSFQNAQVGLFFQVQLRQKFFMFPKFGLLKRTNLSSIRL